MAKRGDLEIVRVGGRLALGDIKEDNLGEVHRHHVSSSSNRETWWVAISAEPCHLLEHARGRGGDGLKLLSSLGDLHIFRSGPCFERFAKRAKWRHDEGQG